MFPESERMRADAELSPLDLLGKRLVSANVCGVTYPIRKLDPTELSFPPTPPGGWPKAVDPTTRKPGQWHNRRHIGERLYANVTPNGPEMRPGLGHCWQWLGPRTGSGSVRQGQITWRERHSSPQKVHRVVWELWNGPIPSGKQLNHHCDNPVCVRLDHLYLGTQLDNMRDASRRGRFHVARTTSSLTPHDRLAIFNAAPYHGVCRDLAVQYGVTIMCISKIRRGLFIRPAHLPHDADVPVEGFSGVGQSVERVGVIV